MVWKKSSLIWTFFPWFWLKTPGFSLISLTGKSLQNFPWIPWSVGTLLTVQEFPLLWTHSNLFTMKHGLSESRLAFDWNVFCYFLGLPTFFVSSRNLSALSCRSFSRSSCAFCCFSSCLLRDSVGDLQKREDTFNVGQVHKKSNAFNTFMHIYIQNGYYVPFPWWRGQLLMHMHGFTRSSGMILYFRPITPTVRRSEFWFLCKWNLNSVTFMKR